VSVLVLVLVIGVVGTTLFFTRTYPPLAATYDFTDDLHDGRTEAAFAQTCDRSRTSSARPSFDRFAREVAGADSVSVDLFSVDRTGDSATVEFHTTSDDGDRRTDYTLRLVHEDGDWRPCSV
jgi:hypothetical protein